MLEITHKIFIPEEEIEFSACRSSGPGGQNVNKVASAILLRFNILKSKAFDEPTRNRILQTLKHRLTQTGDIIIKASNHRHQEQNKREARHRLIALIRKATYQPKKRMRTKIPISAKQNRLENKKRRSTLKKDRLVKQDF